MKRAAWVNLALLLLVAALALRLYLEPPTAKKDYPLSTLSLAAVRSIRIETVGNASLLLERNGVDWNLTAPLKARADPQQVQRLLAIAEARTADRLPSTGLERYDLAAPPLSLTLDGQTFAFGAINELTRQQYVLTQGNVYLVSLIYAAALTADPLRLIDKHLFAPNEIPVAFELPDFKLVAQDGRWLLSPPAESGSQDDFNRWVDAWRSASALALQNDAALATRKPLLTIKVSVKHGAPFTITVLQRSPELLLKRNDQPLVYQFAGDLAQRLFTPPEPLLKPPMNADTRR